MESILNSVKKMLGIAPDYSAFDPEIIMHTNSVFMILNQLGVGPKKPFRIENALQVWEEFLPLGDIDAVRSYMYLRVKALFDPPQNGSVQQAYDAQIKELEWRMYTMAEFGPGEGGVSSIVKIYPTLSEAERALERGLITTIGSIVCIPESDRYSIYVVSEGEHSLKLLPAGGTTNYQDLTNKPTIEGEEVDGDKTFEDYNLGAAPSSAIDDIING